MQGICIQKCVREKQLLQSPHLRALDVWILFLSPSNLGPCGHVSIDLRNLYRPSVLRPMMGIERSAMNLSLLCLSQDDTWG